MRLIKSIFLIRLFQKDMKNSNQFKKSDKKWKIYCKKKKIKKKNDFYFKLYYFYN